MKTHGLKSLLCRKQYERVTLRWVLNPLLPLLDCFKGRTNNIYFLEWLWASGEKFGSFLCFSNSAPSRPQVSWVRIRAAMTTQAMTTQANTGEKEILPEAPSMQQLQWVKKKKMKKKKNRPNTWMCSIRFMIQTDSFLSGRETTGLQDPRCSP